MVVLLLCGWAEHDSNRILTDSSNHGEGRNALLAKRPFKGPDFTPSLNNYNNNYCYSLWSKALPDLSVDLEVR